ncbi:sigma-54-dependent Fis family transcriptional regulator [Taurinivorans muris]|jgi:Response regulator containing CheY-like receiver, AAA-type ATPase, and DNA-binding domains|uniref:Sigma-54-dependent Fis family transcriptional regulator n=1 Tax=Taurinivorans muris TaxID=2787751 RepID=A0ABY5XZK6_9BACT|nr:sigma-54-dependent Fis family transcriptional regulator [Desulfovibrionaceae bacterium LT0009]
MQKSTLLIVDDDYAHRNMLKLMLENWHYRTFEVETGEDAVDFVKKQAVDLVLCDVRMTNMDGFATLLAIHEWNPAIPVVLMTAYSSVEKAVEAMKMGAYSYVTKPLDFEVLKATLYNALEHTRLKEENTQLKQALGIAQTMPLGKSALMRSLQEMIETVAPSEATVLITGESGTGKELVAKAIQANSLRKNQAFVTINCAALAENLLESELFGHEKGAFTGADKMREGRFVQADNGTLFLDEIGEMPLALQVKLLRVLQNGEIQRVGSDKVKIVDVRIIAATNRNLQKEVEAGRFREDLYYRLNVIALEVPALRERKDDIPLLAQKFVENFARANRKSIKGFSPQAMDMLMRYDWPGNVRELENAMERAVILTVGEYVTERSLPLAIQQMTGNTAAVPSGILANKSLDDIEKEAISATLAETADNKSEAARRLGITRATLHSKLKKYNLE